MMADIVQTPHPALDPARWIPIRRGAVYCSPACGWKCTWESYRQVVAESATLAARLSGSGKWTSRVWENLGWHCSVTSPCGRICVHPNYYADQLVGYSAFLGEPHSGAGRWAEHGATPEEAIEAVIATAKEDLAKIGAILSGL